MTQLDYRASSSAVYYIPPRAWSIGRTVPSGMIALAVCIPLAWVYVSTLHRGGSFYLDLAWPCLFAVAIGALSIITIRIGRVASLAVATIIGCGLGVWGWYCAWLLFLRRLVIFAGAKVTVWNLIVHPSACLQFARFINRVGTWHLGHNDNVTGVLLLIFWLGEAAIIIAIPLLMSLKAVGHATMHCRACSRPCKRVSPMPRLAADQPDAVVAAVESRNFDALLPIGPLRHEDDPQIDFIVHACPHCDATNILTVNLTAWMRGRDGKFHVKSRTLVNKLLITRAEIAKLKEIRSSLKAMESDSATEDESESEQPPESDGADN